MPRKMDGKERLLCALERGIPDRLPAAFHDWLGFHRKRYMNGLSEIEAFGQVGLVGGMNQFQILSDGTPETIRKEVHSLFEEAGPNDGYTMSTTDHLSEMPVENIMACARAAKELAY